jgi:hypothetical protein
MRKSYLLVLRRASIRATSVLNVQKIRDPKVPSNSDSGREGTCVTPEDEQHPSWIGPLRSVSILCPSHFRGTCGDKRKKWDYTIIHALVCTNRVSPYWLTTWGIIIPLNRHEPRVDNSLIHDSSDVAWEYSTISFKLCFLRNLAKCEGRGGFTSRKTSGFPCSQGLRLRLLYPDYHTGAEAPCRICGWHVSGTLKWPSDHSRTASTFTLRCW